MTVDGQARQPEVVTTTTGHERRPQPRHRAAPTRAGAALVAAAMLVVAIAGGGALTGGQRDYDTKYRHFVTTAQIGEPVWALGLFATVLGVRTEAVITDRPGWRHDTGGVWVLVRVRAMARQEPTSIGYAAVRDSTGRVWRATARVGQPLVDGYRLEPAIPVEAEIAFEVPPEVATDLTLRLAEPRAVNEQALSMELVVEVALPVDQEMVAEAVAAAGTEPPPEPAPLAELQVVIADPQVLVGGAPRGSSGTG